MKITAVIRVGTTGWSIPGPFTSFFPPAGSHLGRYAKRFAAVEIDTTFYELHKPETYTYWAKSVPGDFRFSVKIPRQITHEGQLGDLSLLGDFPAGVQALGDKFGPLLGHQLKPNGKK